MPTAKNEPCRRVFDQSAMTRAAEHGYQWDLTAAYPAPVDVRIDAPAAVAD